MAARKNWKRGLYSKGGNRWVVEARSLNWIQANAEDDPRTLQKVDAGKYR
jgi:hypothetical protein